MVNRLVSALVLVVAFGTLQATPPARPPRHAVVLANTKSLVVYTQTSCSYYIVENAMGYAVLEWFGGGDPSVGDLIYGNVNTYGFKDLSFGRYDQKTKVWIEDYMLSWDRAVEKIRDKCE